MLTTANINELNECYAILDSGRNFQREQGFIQWDDEYPTLDLVKKDIEKHIGYVFKINDKIAELNAKIKDLTKQYDEISEQNQEQISQELNQHPEEQPAE